MKKYLALALCLILAFALAACSVPEKEPVETAVPTEPPATPEASVTPQTQPTPSEPLRLFGYKTEEYHDDAFNWPFDTEDINVVWGDIYTAEDREGGWAFTVPAFAPGTHGDYGERWANVTGVSDANTLFGQGERSEDAGQTSVEAWLTAPAGKSFSFGESGQDDIVYNVSVAVKNATSAEEIQMYREPYWLTTKPGAIIYLNKSTASKQNNTGKTVYSAFWWYGGYNEGDNWVGDFCFKAAKQIDDNHFLVLNMTAGNKAGSLCTMPLTEEQKVELWELFKRTCENVAHMYGIDDGMGNLK